MPKRLGSSDLRIGQHIYFADDVKNNNTKHFKEGVVKEFYKDFVLVEARSTFMGSTKKYNVCLNYVDIDRSSLYTPFCLVQDSIDSKDIETQADIAADLAAGVY